MTKPLETENRGISARLLDQPYLLLILAPLFWGGNVVAAKLVVGEIDPFLLLAALRGRHLVHPAVFRGYLRQDWPVIRRTRPLLMAFGAIGYALFNVLLYVGPGTTTGVNAAIVQAALPMMIPAANFIVFRTSVKPLQIAGVIIAIPGVMLTATHGDLGRILGLDINIGDGFVILACLAYTAYTLALKYRPNVHMMSFMAVAFAGAALTGLVMLQLFGPGLASLASIPQMSPMVWVVIVYVMIFPSMFSRVFYARGVRTGRPQSRCAQP
ncbi:DMT family transporter [Devosia sp. A8/3-2]|nr:DMT family transporter [Devosia sp. A8/3-2]